MNKKLTLLFLLAAVIITSAEVYKWTDTQGNIHYSDTPGPGSTEVVDVPALPQVTPAAPASTATNNTTAPIAATTLPTPEQLKQQAATQAKQVDAFCAQAKANVSLLQETGRNLYTISPNGQYHWYTDTERQEELAKTQKQIELTCPQATDSK